MTVLVVAMHADSSGSVVGRGRGDCSCLTVVSYGRTKEDGHLLLLKRGLMLCINAAGRACVYECACVPAGSPAEGTEAPCERT